MAVDRVLGRGLDKDPESRWPTACSFVGALEDALGDEAEPTPVPVPATAPTAPVRQRPAAAAAAAPRRRSWGPVLAAALIVGLIAGGVIAALIGGGSDKPSSGTQAKRTAPATQKRQASTPAQTAAQAPATQQSRPAAAQASSPSALEQQGHALVQQGSYDQAIALLGKAVKDCPVSRTDPCAYALYDLGHALRLAGRPQEAIPVLQQRLQNPNQRGVVQAELEQAQKDAGQQPAKPKGPKKDKKKNEGD